MDHKLEGVLLVMEARKSNRSVFSRIFRTNENVEKQYTQLLHEMEEMTTPIKGRCEELVTKMTRMKANLEAVHDALKLNERHINDKKTEKARYMGIWWHRDELEAHQQRLLELENMRKRVVEEQNFLTELRNMLESVSAELSTLKRTAGELKFVHGRLEYNEQQVIDFLQQSLDMLRKKAGLGTSQLPSGRDGAG